MTLSITELARHLGSSASNLLADARLKNWNFDREIETELADVRIYYTFPKNGFAFYCDEADEIAAIFLYSDEYEGFEGGLLDLPFSSTRQEVIKRLGSASKSGAPISDPILGDSGPWDRFAKSGYSIHIWYGANSDSIRLITLMRADAVP